MRFLGLFLALVSLSCFAQYSGPAVESCLNHAQAELLRDGTAAKVVFDRDRELNIARYTRKLGSQFVSSLLYGNGAVTYPQVAAIEMSFVCLLADQKRALFFYWTPRRDAPVLAQCRRGPDAAGCLDSLLQVAEQELTPLYAQHYVDARENDSAAKNENAQNAFRKSAEAWRAYRDAECARRGTADAIKACMVELTRRRALDLR